MSLNNLIFSFRSSASAFDAVVYSRVGTLPTCILTTHATDLRSESALCSLSLQVPIRQLQ